MGDWRHMGQGARRRMGAPSSTYGSINPGVQVPMSDMADLQQSIAAGNQYGRQTMGMNPLGDLVSQVDVNSQFQHPELVQAKHEAKFEDPAMVPGAVPKNPVMAEDLGPSFAPKAIMSQPTNPEAGATQSSARVIPSVVPRSADAFNQSLASSTQ